MADMFDNVSEIYKINADITALKNAQLNTAALNQNNNAAKTSATDVDGFLLRQAQSFSSTLDKFLAPTDQSQQSNTSDSFSSLIDQNSTTVASSQNSVDLMRLNNLEQSSALIGREIIYLDEASTSQKIGVVNKVIIDQNYTPIIVLKDGKEILLQALVGIK